MPHTANYSIQETILPTSRPSVSSRVVVTITSAPGFSDTALFLYQEVAGVQTFQAVATPQQLRAYGTSADPLTGFLRRNVCDVALTPSSDAVSFKTALLADLQALCAAATRLDTLAVTSTGSVTG